MGAKRTMKWYRKLIILGIIGLFFGAGFVSGFSTNQNTEIQVSEILVRSDVDWWTCFHHDNANTGFSSSYGPKDDDLLWIFDDFSLESSPVIVNDVIYVGSPHLTSPAWSGSFVFCIDDNGRELWRYKTTGDLKSTPAVSSDRLYIGSSHGHVLCLDARNGEYIWSQQTDDRICSSPVVFDNRVFIGSYDDTLYCLDADSGDILWTFSTDGDIYSSPAVYDNNVYFASLDDYVYCLNAFSGDLIWKFQTGDDVYSSPAIYQDRLYIGSVDRFMYCLDSTTGEKLWSFDTKQKIFESSAAIDEEQVFIGTSFGDVFCFNQRSGEKLWTYQTNGWVSCSPAVTDDYVYVGSLDRYVYCLNTETGQEIWKYKTKRGIESSPAIVNGNLYVTSGSELYCFGNDELPVPDLSCEGNLQWNDIEPGSWVEGSFTICNIGETGSVLNYNVESYPNWGNWSISPLNGRIVSGDCITVQVFIGVPDVEESMFSGEILVVNEDDSSDYETISVSLSTPRNKRVTNPFSQFVRKMVQHNPWLFPIFEHVINV